VGGGGESASQQLTPYSHLALESDWKDQLSSM